MKDLSSFAIKKEAMNELRGGGRGQKCWCGGGEITHTFPPKEQEWTFVELAEVMDGKCGILGWGCNPQ